MKPIRYRVLLADQLSKQDKITVTARVSTMYTGPEADLAAYRRTKNDTWVNENWAFQVLDLLGRVVVLKYKGVEVAMFVKRQVTLVEPLPSDPIPEGVLKDPNDAWMRLDLLGASAREVSSRLGKQKKTAEEQLRLALKELEVKGRLLELLESDTIGLRKTILAKDEELAKWKQKAVKRAQQAVP